MEMYWMTLLERNCAITTLSQVTPKYGAAVSEPSHIRLGFTNKMVYVAVVCLTAHPKISSFLIHVEMPT